MGLQHVPTRDWADAFLGGEKRGRGDSPEVGHPQECPFGVIPIHDLILESLMSSKIGALSLRFTIGMLTAPWYLTVKTLASAQRS